MSELSELTVDELLAAAEDLDDRTRGVVGALDAITAEASGSHGIRVTVNLDGMLVDLDLGVATRHLSPPDLAAELRALVSQATETALTRGLAAVAPLVGHEIADELAILTAPAGRPAESGRPAPLSGDPTDSTPAATRHTTPPTSTPAAYRQTTSEGSTPATRRHTTPEGSAPAPFHHSAAEGSTPTTYRRTTPEDGTAHTTPAHHGASGPAPTKPGAAQPGPARPATPHEGAHRGDPTRSGLAVGDSAHLGEPSAGYHRPGTASAASTWSTPGPTPSPSGLASTVPAGTGQTPSPFGPDRASNAHGAPVPGGPAHQAPATDPMTDTWESHHTDAEAESALSGSVLGAPDSATPIPARRPRPRRPSVDDDEDFSTRTWALKD